MDPHSVLVPQSGEIDGASGSHAANGLICSNVDKGIHVNTLKVKLNVILFILQVFNLESSKFI